MEAVIRESRLMGFLNDCGYHLELCARSQMQRSSRPFSLLRLRSCARVDFAALLSVSSTTTPTRTSCSMASCSKSEFSNLGARAIGANREHVS